VVTVHLVMAANLLVLGVLIWWARRQRAEARALQGVLEGWGLVSALGFTIVVACINQWVSSSITPFLIGCVLVGALFLLRPQRAGVLYLAAFAVFAWSLGLTQGDDARLLSNRVDGFIAASLGFMVSLMIWRKHVLKETLVVELQANRLTVQEQAVSLQSMAVRDTLTGVWNRAEIMRLAQRELTRAQRHGGETCFIVVDLDSFKLINDRWGHATGDRVLLAVANLLVEELRATDEVGRLAGEEFAVLLPQTSLEEARLLAERLHQSIARLRVPLGDTSVRMTASIGAASQTGRALVPVPQQFERLFGAAEQALSSAKSQGRDRVVVAQTIAVSG
jgi:diguanylate cyclase